MGSVFRKTVTKPLPAGAELYFRDGVQWARWQKRSPKQRNSAETAENAKGRVLRARTTISRSGEIRILIKAKKFTASFRDGFGVVREVATGCKEEMAARAVLRDLERRAELVRAGVLTAAEDAIADHQSIPLEKHFGQYIDSLRIKDVSPMRIANMESQFKRLCRECGFHFLADLKADTLIAWLRKQQLAGMAAATRNGYREVLVMFGSWCASGSSPRLTSNPFKHVPRADAKSDPRRQRRAMTEAELVKLLAVARRRPLEDAMTIRRGRRKGEKAAALDPETIERLERVGRERALIYKTLVLTGLRKSELASLTIGQLHLDAEPPYAELLAADEKNRQGSSIPLRSDLAEDLRAWVATRRRRSVESIKIGEGQAPVIDAEPVFYVPAGLVRILNRDLEAAGIPKRDDRGRTIDVHALRHSFGTLLSKGGVAPRVAQEAMRHSSIDLTMEVYTDPRLLDVHGALNSLPALPLNPTDHNEQTAMRATGTDDAAPEKFAVKFAVATAESCGSRPIRAEISPQSESPALDAEGIETPQKTHEKRPLAAIANDLLSVGATGFEPATSTSRT